MRKSIWLIALAVPAFIISCQKDVAKETTDLTANPAGIKPVRLPMLLLVTVLPAALITI